MEATHVSPTRLRVAASIFVFAGAVNFTSLLIAAPAMNGSASEALSEAAANLTAMRILAIHDLLFTMAICLVCLVAVTLPSRRGAALTFVGAAIAVLGNLFHAAVVPIQLIQADMAQAGLDPAQMAALYDRIDNDQWIGATLVPLMFLFPIGMIVLTLGLWRSQMVPLWSIVPAALATLAELGHLPASEQVVPVLAPVTSIIIAGSLVVLSQRPSAITSARQPGVTTTAPALGAQLRN